MILVVVFVDIAVFAPSVLSSLVDDDDDDDDDDDEDEYKGFIRLHVSNTFCCVSFSNSQQIVDDVDCSWFFLAPSCSCMMRCANAASRLLINTPILGVRCCCCCEDEDEDEERIILYPRKESTRMADSIRSRRRSTPGGRSGLPLLPISLSDVDDDVDVDEDGGVSK